MSKVLFLVNHDVVIYNFRLEIVERLLKEGHNVIISSPYGEKIDELVDLGCEYRAIDMSRHGVNIIKEIMLINDYVDLIKQEKPDIVFTFTIKPNIYGGFACDRINVPFVANITGLGTAVEEKSILQKITLNLYRYAFKNVKKVFFQNTENQQLFLDNNIAIDRHELLPGSGVNLERFRAIDYPEDDIIKFAFISRIMKKKGIEQYLEAAKYIKGRYNNVEFHVCGFCEETYEKKLKKLSSKGIIKYHGMIRDVNVFMTKIHCTIHPTYYPEGISNVLLESAACARPIITTNRSGCKEVIEDGKNGYVINQKDSKDLIDKIEKFLKLSFEEKRQMGLYGRKKVEKEFDRNIVVEKYVEQLKG